MRRVEVSPAAIGSLALHVGVAVALMVSWGSRDLKVGGAVPVTIVSSAPDADLRPAVQGPEEQPALAETPAPEAPPTPEPPAPEPTPAPPAPKAAAPAPKAAPPAPKAAPTPKAPAPKATRPAPKPVEESTDFLASLEQSLAKSRPAGGRPSPAPKGAAQPETSRTPRSTAGAGLAAGAALTGLAEELQRRWNPNCEVEGGQNIRVRVTFTVGVGGQVVGNASPSIEGPRTPVAQAAAERAVRAVYAAAPFRSLPREYYGERIAVNFNAREACATR